jgi:hypothetical protein
MPAQTRVKGGLEFPYCGNLFVTQRLRATARSRADGRNTSTIWRARVVLRQILFALLVAGCINLHVRDFPCRETVTERARANRLAYRWNWTWARNTWCGCWMVRERTRRLRANWRELRARRAGGLAERRLPNSEASQFSGQCTSRQTVKLDS